MNENAGGSPTRNRWWLTAVIVSVAVLVAGALIAVVLLTHSGGDGKSAGPAPGAGTPSSTSGPTTTRPTTSPDNPTTAQPATGFHYLPLWPFASRAEAVAWQEGYRAGGHQPWHLDARLTALSFTQDYLGYTNVDKAITVAAGGREDWVTVGFDNPNGQPVPSAVLHLARLGTGTDAPWEVVGTRDTTLTLTTPAYGTTVRSPVVVGGSITGVDESIRVQIRQPGRATPIAQTSGFPAGGDRSPWHVTVPFPASSGPLTIAAATGGHIAQVERFAITGVRY